MDKYNKLLRQSGKLPELAGEPDGKRNFTIPVTFCFLLSSKNQTNHMQKKNRIFFGTTTVLLAASLFLLRSFTPAPVEEIPVCCKKAAEKCPDSKNNNPGGMIIDNMSRQFISLNLPAY